MADRGSTPGSPQGNLVSSRDQKFIGPVFLEDPGQPRCLYCGATGIPVKKFPRRGYGRDHLGLESGFG